MKKIKIINCNIPAKVTPMDKLFAIFRFNKKKIIRDKINTILSTIGAAAAAANLLFVFNNA